MVARTGATAGQARLSAPWGRLGDEQIAVAAAPPAATEPQAPAWKRPLGMILVEAGEIGAAELMGALRKAEGDEARLRDILRLHGMVSEAGLARALAAQYATTSSIPG
jgi:hypothetical protein